jgi:ribosomal protein L37AE/L43A
MAVFAIKHKQCPNCGNELERKMHFTWVEWKCNKCGKKYTYNQSVYAPLVEIP